MQITTKTITIINPNTNKIESFCFSDKNHLGGTNPELYQSNLLKEELIINNIKGKEGELIINGCGESKINPIGELNISVKNDDANKYLLEDQNIKYKW